MGAVPAAGVAVPPPGGGSGGRRGCSAESSAAVARIHSRLMPTYRLSCGGFPGPDVVQFRKMEPAPGVTEKKELVVRICSELYREWKPRAAPPQVRIEFCRYANANSRIRLLGSVLEVRITDLLLDAPLPVLESLAEILMHKLFRRRVPPGANERYRRYLNRHDVRTGLASLRKERGRKELRPPQGEHYDLVELFENVNFRYFHGLMARPELGWSVRMSRQTLGHYDPAHHAIVLSRVLDRPQVPRLAVEYVMFHEMLHLRFPETSQGARRCVHTREFRLAEKQFEGLAAAKALLRRLGTVS